MAGREKSDEFLEALKRNQRLCIGEQGGGCLSKKSNECYIFFFVWETRRRMDGRESFRYPLFTAAAEAWA